FQAEDGIRDWSVTGVQTCALPIYLVHKDANDEAARSRLYLAGGPLGEILRHSDARRALAVLEHTYRDMSQIRSRLLQIREVDLRSEERRVGKEGRSRG